MQPFNGNEEPISYNSEALWLNELGVREMEKGKPFGANNSRTAVFHFSKAVDYFSQAVKSDSSNPIFCYNRRNTTNRIKGNALYRLKPDNQREKML